MFPGGGLAAAVVAWALVVFLFERTPFIFLTSLLYFICNSFGIFLMVCTGDRIGCMAIENLHPMAMCIYIKQVFILYLAPVCRYVSHVDFSHVSCIYETPATKIKTMHKRRQQTPRMVLRRHWTF